MTDCTVVFLRHDDEILLAMKKRGFGAGFWNGAGGKIHDGESIEAAMIRECQEEINVTPTVYDKVAENDFRKDDEHDPWHMHVHVYFATAWQGEPAESEEMAPEWFKLTDIPYSQMWSDDILWLPQVLDGAKIIGNYIFDAQEVCAKHAIRQVKKF